MRLTPTVQYWLGWALAFMAARLFLVQPIIDAIRRK